MKPLLEELVLFFALVEFRAENQLVDQQKCFGNYFDNQLITEGVFWSKNARHFLVPVSRLCGFPVFIRPNHSINESKK